MTAQQLKNAILQEAIEGRLVPQDPNDEPASALLARIREEKMRLVKEGKLKKKDLVEKPISEDEIPFEIPESWEWVRLAKLCSRFSTGPFGTMVHKEDYVDENGHPLINPTNIKDGRICYDGIKMISNSKYDELNAYVLHFNDLVIARRGDLSKVAIVSEKEDGWLAGTGAFFMHLFNGVYLPYFLLLYTSSYCQTYLLAQSVGGTMNNLNQSLLADLFVPLPPLAEQQRIVAKIEELLPMVEEYGKAQESLDKLNEELPERLKKSILQEAIEGRLVPQDSNEEPASVLLDKIRKEKARLVMEGKLKKKDLIETPIEEDEIPFKIPDSWEWVRLGSVCDYLHRGKSPKYGTQKKLPIIAQKCNQWDKIYTDRCLFSDSAYTDKYTLEQYLQVGDVIINSTGGGTVGRTGYVDTYVFDEYSCFVVDSHVTVVRGNKLIYSKYIYFFLISPYIQWGLEDRCSGSTNQIELGTSTISNYIFPLPPLAEQKRIVEKIEQLFKQIDHLKK